MKFKLPRTKQCAKCPWKKATNPYDIPNEYSKTKHENLEKTIAKEGEINFGDNHVMACHHSSGEDKMYCVGWLDNQLNDGNNILLRLRMRECENIGEIEVFGEQHKHFRDTLPK